MKDDAYLPNGIPRITLYIIKELKSLKNCRRHVATPPMMSVTL